jgi:hypothetical protein
MLDGDRCALPALDLNQSEDNVHLRIVFNLYSQATLAFQASNWAEAQKLLQRSLAFVRDSNIGPIPSREISGPIALALLMASLNLDDWRTANLDTIWNAFRDPIPSLTPFVVRIMQEYFDKAEDLFRNKRYRASKNIYWLCRILVGHFKDLNAFKLLSQILATETSTWVRKTSDWYNPIFPEPEDVFSEHLSCQFLRCLIRSGKGSDRIEQKVGLMQKGWEMPPHISGQVIASEMIRAWESSTETSKGRGFLVEAEIKLFPLPPPSSRDFRIEEQLVHAYVFEGDPLKAKDLIRRFDWKTSWRPTKENVNLALAALCRARLQPASSPARMKFSQSARNLCSEGLEVAKEKGYHIDHADLITVLGMVFELAKDSSITKEYNKQAFRGYIYENYHGHSSYFQWEGIEERKEMLAKGLDPGTSEALIYCLQHGHVDNMPSNIIACMAAGANPVEYWDGRSPLQEAIRLLSESLKPRKSSGLDQVDSRNDGQHHSRKRLRASLKFMLFNVIQSGNMIDQKDIDKLKSGRLPILHWALSHHKIDTVKWCLDHGFSATEINRTFEISESSPLTLAYQLVPSLCGPENEAATIAEMQNLVVQAASEVVYREYSGQSFQQDVKAGEPMPEIQRKGKVRGPNIRVKSVVDPLSA